MRTLLSREAWPMSNDKIKVAVIGTGNIGTDLCERLLKDPKFSLKLIYLSTPARVACRFVMESNQ